MLIAFLIESVFSSLIFDNNNNKSFLEIQLSILLKTLQIRNIDTIYA